VSNSKKTRGPGRPPLPKNHAKARIVPVRFSPEEYKAIVAASKASKQTLSEWIRSTLIARMK
jgi:predicted HicB family RNase H-like nuclease